MKNISALQKILNKKKIDVKAILIPDIKTYRGFYIELDNEFYVANFNTNCIKKNAKYSLGFELSHGGNVVEHLYSKKHDYDTFSQNEKVALFEMVNINTGTVVYRSQVYDFSSILIKVPTGFAYLVDGINYDL
jgi:hypothetical protein